MKRDCDESKTNPSRASNKKYGLAEMDGHLAAVWMSRGQMNGNRSKSL